MIPINCRTVSWRASRGEFDDASWLTRWLVRVHLSFCKHCQKYRRQMDLISETAKRRDASSIEESKLRTFKQDLIRKLTP